MSREVRGFSLGQCRDLACGGLWLPRTGLEKLAGRPVPLEDLGGGTHRRCAFCRTTLETAISEHGIPVEACKSCHGVYLDAGEKQELTGRTFALPLAPAVGQDAPGMGFTCVRCQTHFPYSEGNAYAGPGMMPWRR